MLTAASLRDRVATWRESRWLAPVLVAVAPVLILVVLRTSPYFRLNNGDPFIYVGYANDFRGHVIRYGYTYYAVRWGLIFPLKAALAFGPVWGFFILRYVLYQVALVPLYLALRPHGRRVALFGVIVFVANPVTAQSILSTYHDSITVPVMTALVSTMLIAIRGSRRRLLVLSAVAGCLVGVAINANLFFLPLAGFVMAVFCITLLVWRRVVDAVASGAAFVVAMVLVCVAGVLVYNALFSDPDIYETSFNAMRELSGDTAWRSPTIEWMETRRYVYAPYVAMVIAAIAVVRTQRSPERRPFLLTFGIAGGLLLLYALNQFALEGNSMEHAYYYAYVMGPTCLVLAFAVGELSRDSRPPWWVLLAPLPLAVIPQMFEMGSFVLFLLIALVAIAAMVWARPYAVVVLVGLTVMHVAWGMSPRHETILAPGSFHYEPHYEIVFGDADDTAFESYVLANELSSVVPTHGDVRRPVLFWYESGDRMLDSVQASYLWQVSTVQRAPHPGMPTLAPEDEARLAGIVTGYVVLLARTAEKVDAGLAALEAKGYGMEFVSEETLEYDDSAVHTLVVRLVSVPA